MTLRWRPRVRARPRLLLSSLCANGTRSLRLAALDLVKRGVTTLDEIKRVTLNA